VAASVNPDGVEALGPVAMEGIDIGIRISYHPSSSLSSRLVLCHPQIGYAA
jgi:hypothetical protein